MDTINTAPPKSNTADTAAAALPVTGFLVSAADDEAALEEALDELLADDEPELETLDVLDVPPDVEDADEPDELPLEVEVSLLVEVSLDDDSLEVVSLDVDSLDESGTDESVSDELSVIAL